MNFIIKLYSWIIVMEDHLKDFENPTPEPVKTKRVIYVYLILIVALIAVIARAYIFWKRITHH